MTYREIFWAELKAHRINLCLGCNLYNSHTRGFVTRDPIMCLGKVVDEHKTVHLRSSIATRKSLHRGLHEIGHLVNDERGQKRYEREAGANWYAERRMRELGIPVPRVTAAKGRQYVSRMKRWGRHISESRSEKL